MLFLTLSRAALVLSLLYGSGCALPPLARVGTLARRDCHSPSNRACWKDGFDINTDYEERTPTTGVVRSYTFDISEIDNYVGADGVVKEKAMLINGQFPGPTLRADWGDTFQVTVINNLRTNGTGIHWHGLRQLRNNINDGTPGITECPIPPGHSKTYTFLAGQYGTTWYHTHVSSQYAYGVTGSIVIDGPASLPYEIDLGPFPISDWFYPSADKLLHRGTDPNNPFIPGQPGSPPASDNVFFNGTNINPLGPGGAYARVVLTPGKRHRLRLVNPSVDNTFTVSVVGHQMTVISVDLVPVNAFTTGSIFLGIGQRYDVTIDASQAVGNYWINASFSSNQGCGRSQNPFPAAILSYEGANDALPTDRGTAPPDSFCSDPNNFQPVVARSAPASSFSSNASSTLPVTFAIDNVVSKVFWRVNASAIDVQWEKPVLQYVMDGNLSLQAAQNVIRLPDGNQWSIWLITNESPIPHPMHLHGHDFLFLGRSDVVTDPNAAGARPIVFNPATDTGRLRFNNPVRRDSTMLGSWGWIALAFRTDNPGAWLFHCHIAFHASQGLSVDFLERPSEIASSMDLREMTPNCDNWRAFAPSAPPKVDSGI